MKITYDKKTDAVYIRLSEGRDYRSSRKVTDDVVVDYSKKGKVLGIEILSASANIDALPDLS